MYIDIAGYLDRIKTMEMVRVILPYFETFAQDKALDTYIDGHCAGARHAWKEAGKSGEVPEWPLEIDEEGIHSKVKECMSILPETLGLLEREQAKHALTLWRGFEEFCEESVGLEATTILKVVLGAGVERVEELEALTERLGIEPEKQTVEEIARELAEAWQVVERAG